MKKHDFDLSWIQQVEVYSPEDVPVYDSPVLTMQKTDEITAIYKVIETT